MMFKALEDNGAHDFGFPFFPGLFFPRRSIQAYILILGEKGGEWKLYFFGIRKASPRLGFAGELCLASLNLIANHRCQKALSFLE